MVLGGAGVNPLVGILVSLATAILAILLVVLYVARDLVLLVVTVLGPLALASYALPQTEEIARVCALHGAEREAELKKLKAASGLDLYCPNE